MSAKQTRPLSARLEGVQRRFEHWRRTRKVLSRVPEPLWAAAVKMAGRCGIAHTAKTLRVNYNVLKKRVERQAAAVQSEPAENTTATFLELAASTRIGCCQCTLELEDISGAKMRVHLHSAEAPDLAALSRSFWEPRS